MHALERLHAADVVRLGAELRRSGDAAGTMEELAAAVADVLRTSLVDGAGQAAPVLVRVVATIPAGQLPPPVRPSPVEAPTSGPGGPDADAPLVVVLSGDSPGVAVSGTVVAQPPAIREVLQALGEAPADGRTGTDPEPGWRVACVHAGDGDLPAADRALGLRSVLGLGGILPGGGLLVALVSSTAPVSPEAAARCTPLAGALALAALPVTDGPLFDGAPRPERRWTRRRGQLERAAYRQLLDAAERASLAAAASARRQEDADDAAAHSRAILSSALDAVVTMDDDGVIRDANPAAAVTFGWPVEDLVGADMADRLVPEDLRPAHRAGLRRFLDTGVGPLVGARTETTALRADGTTFPVELALSVTDAGPAAVFAATMRDITSRRRAEEALESERRAAVELARTLQSGLLPPSLAEPPGIEVAARYRAVGDGGVVGGDFYDLYRSGPDRWTVVLGDVKGKGVPAARVTALARYTLRAAVAAGVTRPSAMLDLLNAAVAGQEPEQWCTVAVGQLAAGDPGTPCWVEIACGGHPQPILVEADGTLRPVGGRGGLVGWDRTMSFASERVDVALGATLVWYTDGVTDTRGPGGRFRERRLIELLRRPWSSAGAAADAVMDATARWAGSSPTTGDDTALLVLRRTS